MASGRPVANELEGYPSRTLVTTTFLKKNSPFLSHSNILQHFDPKCSQERTRHACQAAQTAPRPPKEATRNLKSSQEASKSSQGAPRRLPGAPKSTKNLQALETPSLKASKTPSHRASELLRSTQKPPNLGDTEP